MLYNVLALPPGRNDVQFRFLDAARLALGAEWSSVGVTEKTLDGTPLGYSIDTDAPAQARYIVWRVAAYPAIVAEEGVNAEGILTPEQADQLASAAEDADAIRTRLAEQVPEPRPVIIFPTPPAPFTNWVVVAVYFNDFGEPRAGVSIKATLQGAAPYSLDNDSFQVDAVLKAMTGTELAARLGLSEEEEEDAAFVTPDRGLYFLMPPNPLIIDGKGGQGTTWRFDSNGLKINDQQEAIKALVLSIEGSGSLWQIRRARLPSST